MLTWVKVLLVTLAFGLPTIPLGQMIWPNAPSEIAPTSQQVFHFIVLSGFEALAFGLGVSLLLFGQDYLKNLPVKIKSSALIIWAILSWMLVSWWPHDRMHAHNGEDLNGLILIEYTFHVGLIILTAILAYQFFKLLSDLSKKS